MSKHLHHARRLSTLAAIGGLAIVLGLVPATAAAADPITVADFQLPPQDAAGWSRLAPSADSRLLYVDSRQGDDGNGKVYLPGDPEIGPDPQSPRGTVRAFRSIAAAYAQTRENQPDWLLLRADRAWNERLDLRSGRSPSERAVATSWGSGARPELRTGADKGIGNYQLTNAAIVGIRFWAHTRDSDGPHFTGYDGDSGISMYSRTRGDRRQVRDVLIEDCVFRAYRNNVLTGSRQGSDNEPITRFVIRRSIISGNYATDAHAQGLFHTGAGQPVQPSILLQENLFDHNGWRVQQRGNMAQAEGQATMFNHNTYFAHTRGVVFQRNLFLRASSMGNKWTGDSGDVARALVMDDNLYLEGEIGIGIGGNSEGPARFQDVVVRNNVLTDIGRSRPTNRSLSWAIELSDWRGGEVVRNLAIHNRTGITNAFALKTSAGTRFEDVVIGDNVLAIATGAGTPAVQLGKGANVVFRDNTVASPSDSRVMRLEGGGFFFGGTNRYLTDSSQPFHIDGVARTLAQWRADTGDSGATDAAPAFPAPQRDLESYAATLGLDGLDGLLKALYGQSRANWNPKLTAGVINDWLRAGYGMAPAQGTTRVRSTGRAPLAPPAAAGQAAAAGAMATRPASGAGPAAPAAATAPVPAATQAGVAPADIGWHAQAATIRTDAPAPTQRSLRSLVLKLLPFLMREDGRAEDTRPDRRSHP